MVLNSQVNIHSEKEQKKSETSWKTKSPIEVVTDHLITRVWKTKNILIAGYGVVGSAFDKILTDAEYPHDICDPYLIKGKKLKEYYHTIHICFPCYFEDIFIEHVVGYMKTFIPSYVIIHSTIGINTLKKIRDYYVDKDIKLFHAPVRGVEDEGADGIKRFKTFVGGINPNWDMSLAYYLDNLGLNWKWVRSYKEAALGKIVGTSWYGMVIAFANQIRKYCDTNDIHFEHAYTLPMRTDEIGREYYRGWSGERAAPEFSLTNSNMIPRPVNVPGVIRGHCVMPNLKFLRELSPDGLVDWIEFMNNYMKIREVEKGKEEDEIKEMEIEREEV